MSSKYHSGRRSNTCGKCTVATLVRCCALSVFATWITLLSVKVFTPDSISQLESEALPKLRSALDPNHRSQRALNKDDDDPYTRAVIPPPVSPDLGADQSTEKPFTHVLCNYQDQHKLVLDVVGVVQGEAKRNKPRLLCAVYTFHEKHEPIKTIYDTWGKRCDGFAVFSDIYDPLIPTIVIKQPGGEDYRNLWQKVRTIMFYVQEHLMDQYDWVMIVGHDTYVIVENLRTYLTSMEIREASDRGKNPLYVGRRFKTADGTIFNSGGPGYLLDKLCLKKLTDFLPSCNPDLQADDDTQVARCLQQINIFPLDTRDKLGRERFHPFTPRHHLEYVITDDFSKNWYWRFSFDLKLGVECCSEGSISFHYADSDLMKRIDTILYDCRQDGSVLGMPPLATRHAQVESTRNTSIV